MVSRSLEIFALIIDEFEFNEVASQYRGDNRSYSDAGPVYKLGYVGRQAKKNKGHLTFFQSVT